MPESELPGLQKSRKGCEVKIEKTKVAEIILVKELWLEPENAAYPATGSCGGMDYSLCE